MNDQRQFQQAVGRRARALFALEPEDVQSALPDGWSISIKRDSEWGDCATVSAAGTSVFKIEESYGTIEFGSLLGEAETEERLAKLRTLAVRLLDAAEAVRAVSVARDAAIDAIDALDAPEVLRSDEAAVFWMSGPLDAVSECGYTAGPSRSKDDAVSQLYEGDYLVGMSAPGKIVSVERWQEGKLIDVPGGIDGVLQPALHVDPAPREEEDLSPM